MFKRKRKVRPQPVTFWGKAWHFLWYEDSIWSWIANIVLAFVLIKFVVYPVIGLVFGTSLPVVAVVSESMDHGYVRDECRPLYRLCSSTLQERPYAGQGFDKYWETCGSWYDVRDITEEEFKDYPLHNGFSKGDLILLRGKPLDRIEEGDIIVFAARKPYPIIHRVVGITEQDGQRVFQTKGDHNPVQITEATLDETAVRENQVIGVAWGQVPYLGWVKILLVDLVTKDPC